MKAYKLTNHGLDVEETLNKKMVYFDQTDYIIHETLNKYAGVPLRVLEE